jgi:hypothetical protein
MPASHLPAIRLNPGKNIYTGLETFFNVPRINEYQTHTKRLESQMEEWEHVAKI